MEKQTPLAHLHDLLLQNNLWPKQASEGAHSLLRALSVCLYFTERYHSSLQHILLSYFKLRYPPLLKSPAQRKTLDRYFENMSLLEFEPLTLKIISVLFNTNITVYFLENSLLKKHAFSVQSSLHLSLIRISEQSYAALFPKEQKLHFILAQNIVLSLAEAVIGSSSFELKNHNSGKLVNYDFDKWAFQSAALNSLSLSKPLINFNLFLVSPTPQIQTKTQVFNQKNEFVGSEIISLFRKRKNSNPKKNELPVFKQHLFNLSNLAQQARTSKQTHNKNPPKKNGNNKLQNKEKTLIISQFDNALGDFFEIDLLSNFNYPDSQPTDLELSPITDLPETNTRLFETRKNSEIEDFAVFLPNDEYSLTVNPLFGSTKIHKSPDKLIPGNSDIFQKDQSTSPLKSEKSKLPKVSLKEKLLKKQISTNLKIDFSSINYFHENSVNQPKLFQINEKQTIYNFPELKTEQSQKLISELKNMQFGKEKYTEIVENRVYQGILKFFDEKNGFGFFQIVKENEFEDVFVYKSEFDKANIKVESLKNLKHIFSQTYSFQIAIYFANSDRRKKAINIKPV